MRLKLALPANEVHVWYSTTEVALHDAQPTRLLALLSPPERSRYSRFLFDKDRRQYLLAHAQTRLLLSRYDVLEPEQWEFTTNAFGKPRIASQASSPALHFSLSHTDGLVACAIAAEPDLGLDVENTARGGSWMSVARHCFTPAEMAYLESLPADTRHAGFFDVWILKEAYIKARGLGLSLPLRSFTIHPATKDGSEDFCFSDSAGEDPTTWQFARFAPSRSHRGAIAIRRASGRAWSIELHDASSLWHDI